MKKEIDDILFYGRLPHRNLFLQLPFPLCITKIAEIYCFSSIVELSQASLLEMSTGTAAH